MRIDLRGDLRLDFLMVWHKMSDTDRREFERRCICVFEASCRDANAQALMLYDVTGKPDRCEIQLDAARLGRFELEWRLSVIAHEIGHVMTCRKDMSHFQAENLADNFACALGFPYYRTRW
jgi:hypothetical protein